MQVRHALRASERRHGAREQLPRLLLALQQFGRGELVEEAPEGRAVRLEEEEFPPEALGKPGILVVLFTIPLKISLSFFVYVWLVSRPNGVGRWGWLQTYRYTPGPCQYLKTVERGRRVEGGRGGGEGCGKRTNDKGRTNLE